MGTSIYYLINIHTSVMFTSYRYLYWSILGSGGGIFQLDLALAKSGNCFSPAAGVVRIVGDLAGTGISSMTLNLEDALLYFAYNTASLSSISLRGGMIVNYSHGGTGLNGRSIASYNEYLAVTTTGSIGFVLGIFVQIIGSQNVVVIRTLDPDPTPAGHLYMIREEFQPLPGMLMLCLPSYHIIVVIIQYHLDL